MTLPGTAEVRLWSVTTLLKMGLGTSPGLVNWQCTQTALVSVEKRATIDAMLADVGKEETLKWIAAQRWNITEKAKARGTAIHKWAEALTLGQEPPELQEHELPYGEQLYRWLERFKPEFLQVEAPVYNVAEHYAGTLDGIVVIDGVRLLVDYKTTEWSIDSGHARHPFPEVALQLAAYRFATEVGVISEQRYDGRNQRYYIYDPTQHHEPMQQVDGAICIVVSPYDCTAVPVRCDDDVFDVFLHARECARFADAGGRDLFRAPLTLKEAPHAEPSAV